MSFRSRLLSVMLAVVVFSLTVTGGAFLRVVYQDALAKGEHDLDVGVNVLQQILDERGQQLRSNVAILADDFGFKSAVATQDTDTLRTVLANHGDRAGADMVLLSDLSDNLLASSHHPAGNALPFTDLLEQARLEGAGVDVIVEAGQPYEFVLLPVRAPNLIGWVGMGFLIDEPLIEEIHTLTRLDISVITQPSGDTPSYLVSSRRGLANQVEVPDTNAITNDPDYLTRELALNEAGPQQTLALVQVSRASLLAAYRNLQWQLLAIVGLILLLTTAAAAWSARSMSLPLTRLTDAARRIGLGQRLETIGVSPRGEIGLLAGTLLSMQADIDERERTLLHRSRHDPLTDLPNRSSAQECITALIGQGQPFSLLRLAIDRFRDINDTFGYALGDRALVTLAQRLANLPSSDFQAFRLSDNEFLLLVHNVALPDGWEDRLLNDLSDPIELDASPFRPSLSAGEAHSPAHGEDAHLLLRRADIALETARRQRSPWQCYQPGQDEQHFRQLTLIRDLQEAARESQLWMAYQPKIDASTGRVCQFEALMRWQHPSLGFIPPDEFITLAERSGNIRLLTRWMIDSVCHQLAEWRRAGQPHSVAINLSAEDVIDPQLGQHLLSVLDHYGLDVEQLSLEVTESAVMQDPALANRCLNELRQAGLTVAIDDFGTGYSSLAQLKQLPVAALKIDKSFVMSLDTQPDDVVIVRSTIELGHRLGLRVIAEGVETAAIAAMLCEFGCDELQGYLIAKPLPGHEVATWLAHYRPRDILPLA
ncbi:diguanylate cyclase/phosphodiesterase [Franzmannia pantelleriensis]|uniref:cyclic-guanylate-specific phosphodiesterase n=1 Tax=Franzmannia pantelleriensis TaxID=48727 RepID=A0A1G9UFV7_9GAMM|nr:EAL domain-containing protein [Halomonas pantelleriensis]SDM58778.1 diguanylate cyclase/phosphodiesterase [Halomonas pantelleriensis]